MRHLTLIALAALLATSARATDSAPLASADACGPWDGSNGRVTEAVKEGLLETLHAYERVLPTRPPDAAARWRELARLSEDMAMWSVALWATAGREALPRTPTSELKRCASRTSSQPTGGHPRATCAEAAAFHDDLQEVGRDARTLFEGGKVIRDGRILPPAPSPGLLRLARRHLGCGAASEVVPRAPRQLVTRQEVQRTLKTRVARDELLARFAERRKQREAAAAAEAAARAEAERVAAEAAALETRIAEYRAAPKDRQQAFLFAASEDPTLRELIAAYQDPVRFVGPVSHPEYGTGKRGYFLADGSTVPLTDQAVQDLRWIQGNGSPGTPRSACGIAADILNRYPPEEAPLRTAAMVTQAIRCGITVDERSIEVSRFLLDGEILATARKRTGKRAARREAQEADRERQEQRARELAATRKRAEAAALQEAARDLWRWKSGPTTPRKPVTGSRESRASDERMKQRQYEIELDRSIYGTRR